MITMKNIAITLMLILSLFAAVSCGDPAADVVSENLSTAADQFEIDRRVVFFNGITDTYLMTIEGRCSITDEGKQLEVTCKVGDEQYKKHFLGLSDNVSYFVEQVQGAKADAYRYRVIFRPETIIPDPEIDTSGG
jgi:hypothetical protein